MPGGDVIERPGGDVIERPGGDVIEPPGGDVIEPPGGDVLFLMSHNQTQDMDFMSNVPPREVTTTDISITSKYVGKAWKLLGRELGFLDGELETLRIDYYAEGQRETTYQMLRKWKNKNGSAATLEVLVKGLHIVNRDDVIQILLARKL